MRFSSFLKQKWYTKELTACVLKLNAICTHTLYTKCLILLCYVMFYFRGIERLYTMSYIWYSSLGVLTCVVVGLIVSFITGKYITAGLQIRVRIEKLFSLFLIQNICCGYTKEPSQ